jgi:hypothetical protein
MSSVVTVRNRSRHSQGQITREVKELIPVGGVRGLNWLIGIHIWPKGVAHVRIMEWPTVRCNLSGDSVFRASVPNGEF